MISATVFHHGGFHVIALMMLQVELARTLLLAVPMNDKNPSELMMFSHDETKQALKLVHTTPMYYNTVERTIRELPEYRKYWVHTRKVIKLGFCDTRYVPDQSKYV